MTNDPQSPVELTSVPTDIEASSIVAVLATEGIEALTTGGFTAEFQAEAPGNVSVVVRSEDLDTAKQILKKFEQGPGVEWSDADLNDTDDA